MSLKTIEITKKVRSNSILQGYVFDEENPDKKTLTYKINKNKKTIEFFPSRSEFYFFDRIKIVGLSTLPEIFNKKGYMKNNLLYYLNSTFEKGIKDITVCNSGNSQIFKRGRSKYLHFRLADLEKLSKALGSLNYYNNNQKSITTNRYFSRLFPELIKEKVIKIPKYKIKGALNTLQTLKPEIFDAEDINSVISILSSLLKTKYKSQIKRSELFSATKLTIDTVTLDEVISEFKENLDSGVSESKWGNFLQRNLFLIDSKYIHSIPQLNLVLGGTRKVDFGLVDIQGYLDLYEI